MAELVGEDPDWEAPLRFFAALHYLVLDGDEPELAAAYRGEAEVWPAVRATLERRREWVARFVREQPVQTNEVGRCSALLPGFLAALAADPRPVELVELGPSAGLNLLWDRYRYRYGDLAWGPDDAPLELEGELRGPIPRELFEVEVEVRRRVGIDRAPLDVARDEDVRLLESFLWADQPERLERVRRAIDVARADPPELVAGDYVDLLPRVLAGRDPEALAIVYSSASTAYLTDDEFARLEAAIGAAGEEAPLAWLSMEPPRETPFSQFGLELRRWPGGECRRLADVHYHGAWIEWLG